jgi:hypothetical protein
MSSTAQRLPPDAEPCTDEKASSTRTKGRVVTWMHDEPVCVTIVDAPRWPHATPCRCGTSSECPDLAEQYLQD